MKDKKARQDIRDLEIEVRQLGKSVKDASLEIKMLKCEHQFRVISIEPISIWNWSLGWTIYSKCTQCSLEKSAIPTVTQAKAAAEMGMLSSYRKSQIIEWLKKKKLTT